MAINTTADVDRLLPELSQKGASMVKTFNKCDRNVYNHLVKKAETYLCGSFMIRG